MIAFMQTAEVNPSLVILLITLAVVFAVLGTLILIYPERQVTLLNRRPRRVRWTIAGARLAGAGYLTFAVVLVVMVVFAFARSVAIP